MSVTAPQGVARPSVLRYTAAGTYSFVVQAGVSRVMFLVIGAGGGGGGGSDGGQNAGQTGQNGQASYVLDAATGGALLLCEGGSGGSPNSGPFGGDGGVGGTGGPGISGSFFRDGASGSNGIAQQEQTSAIAGMPGGMGGESGLTSTLLAAGHASSVPAIGVPAQGVNGDNGQAPGMGGAGGGGGATWDGGHGVGYASGGGGGGGAYGALTISVAPGDTFTIFVGAGGGGGLGASAIQPYGGAGGRGADGAVFAYLEPAIPSPAFGGLFPDAKRDFGAVGSGLTTTGTSSAYSTTITNVQGVQDFVAGQSVAVNYGSGVAYVVIQSIQGSTWVLSAYIPITAQVTISHDDTAALAAWAAAANAAGSGVIPAGEYNVSSLPSINGTVRLSDSGAILFLNGVPQHRVTYYHPEGEPVNVLRETFASGSSQSTTGSITAGSTTLTLASAIDFQVGQGIGVANAGPLPTISAPAAPTVTATGTTGTTTWAYAVAALDGKGGETAASPVTTITNGNATLSSTNYNAISWTAVSGAAGYAVYRSTAGGTPNTTGLVAIVSGTSLDDTGLATITPPVGVAASAPASALGDLLVSTIQAISGTTITLKDAASTAVTNAAVKHNDRAAIDAAIAAAGANETIIVPPGTYNVDATPSVPAGVLWLDNGATLADSGTGATIARSAYYPKFTGAVGGAVAESYGPATPTAGSAAALSLAWERSAGQLSSEIGGLYPGTAQTFLGASEVVASGSTLTQAFAFSAQIVNASGSANAVALWADAVASGAGTAVWGGNLIARNASGATNSKLVGLEIDMEPTAGTTLATSGGGLFINMFNLANPCPAIQIGGVSGGTWQNGILIGGIASNGAGIAPLSGAQMGALVNTSGGTYSTAAIELGNTHRILLAGTAAGRQAQLYNDSADNFRILNGYSGGSIVFRNAADTVSLWSINDSGIMAGGSTSTINWNAAMTAATATAGTTTLPANPVGFIIVQVAGTTAKIPYYGN